MITLYTGSNPHINRIVTKDTVLKLPYFKTLIKLNPNNQIFVDLDYECLEAVIEFLRNEDGFSYWYTK